jgi:hypothetical protein
MVQTLLGPFESRAPEGRVRQRSQCARADADADTSVRGSGFGVPGSDSIRVDANVLTAKEPGRLLTDSDGFLIAILSGSNFAPNPQLVDTVLAQELLGVVQCESRDSSPDKPRPAPSDASGNPTSRFAHGIQCGVCSSVGAFVESGPDRVGSCSVMVAAKFLDDFYYSNEFWAKVRAPRRTVPDYAV